MRLQVCVLAAALGVSVPGAAQTVIVADTAADRATGTIVTRDGTTTTIDGGTLAGRNLFHSLAAFTLANGDTAAWTFSFGDPAAIRNVISRVTSGERSVIDGRIDSTALPNADFFLINPAGIVLGQSAQVDVPAAARFAAASDIQFLGGERYSAATPGGSTFSMANPVSFGFLGNEGALAVLGGPASQPISAPGGLTLAGRDVSVTNRTLESDDGLRGGLHLLAAGASEIRLPISPASVEGTLARGELSLVGALLRSSRQPISAAAGDIRVVSTQFILDTRSDSDNALISLDASRRLSVQNSTFTSTGSQGATAGSVIFTAPIIALSDGTSLITDQNGTGFGGLVFLVGDEITLTDSSIQSVTRGEGDGGTVGIHGRQIAIRGNSRIETTSLGGGLAGQVALRASEAIVLSDNAVLASNNLSGRSFLGLSGLMSLEAPRIAMTGDALISASAFGVGNAGSIRIDAGSFTMDGGRIALTTMGQGRAGKLDIAAATIDLANHATISSDTSGGGSAGSISILATSGLSMRQGVTISSSTSGQGQAGTIAITAEGISLDRSAIRTAVLPGAGGGAGDITVTASDSLVLGNGSQIASSNDGLATGAASAGTITLAARSIELADGSQITTNSALGPAGAISFALPPSGLVRLRGGPLGPSIITTSSGPGTGGVITIGEPLAIISQGGSILALGEQAGANVVIRSQFYIDAADTLDLIRIDGDFTFDGELDYVAAGEEPRDLSLLDAGAVLAGRCRAAQARGRSSQLGIASIGPYGTLDPEPDPEPEGDAGVPLGDGAWLARPAAARPCG